jgi:hypothetical protein
MGVWGILYYVTYVFTGRTTMFLPYLVYYLGIFAVLAAGTALDTSEAERFMLSVSRLAIMTGPLLTGAIIALLLPVIVACGFYFSLYFAVDDPVQKYRVGLTSGAFIAWFGSAVAATLLGIAHEPWWAVLGRSIGVAASIVVFMAYWPPRSLHPRSPSEPRRRELIR